MRLYLCRFKLIVASLVVCLECTNAHPSPFQQESAFFAELKAAQPFFLMAGPNVVESEAHCLKLARQIKAVTELMGVKLVFKASFDKANRTSAATFRGPGLEEGLRCQFCFVAVPVSCCCGACLALHTAHMS